MDSENVIERSIGEFGCWQLIIVLLIFASQFAVAWYQVLVLIVSPPANFTCTNPNLDKCSENCTKHEFDRSIFTETIITEWDLVCERTWIANFIQTIVMLGILTGNLIFGYLADKYGRTRPLVIAAFFQAAFGTAAAFVPWLWLYIIFRYFSTVATGGLMLTTFVLMIEVTGKKFRTLIGALFQIPFNLGYAALGLIGYLLRDWHHIQMAVALPQTFLICYWCILPESPRWLLTIGRTDSAIKILEHAAAVNKLPTERIRPEIEQLFQTSNSNENVEVGNIFDLVRTKRMRTKTLCLFLIWIVTAMDFFGMAQYMGQIGGDMFINIAASGLIQIPGNFLAIYTMDKFGRKCSLIFAYVTCFISCIIIPCLPTEPTWPISLFGCIGVMGIFMSFTVLYVYTSELYPTVIRNIGMGLASTIGRIGSMISPFVTQLKDVQPWLTPLIFAIFSLISSLVTFIFLPETYNVKMPDKIEEADAL